MKKILTNFLQDSIASLLLLHRSKKDHPIDRKQFSTNQKLKENHHKLFVQFDWFLMLVDRSKRTILSIQNKFWSIKTCDEIFQKFFASLDWSNVILDQTKLVKLNFPKFSPNSFQRFFMNKLPSYEYNRLSLRSKTEFHWCYNLKVQFNTHLTSNWDIIITSISVLVNNSFIIYVENWSKKSSNVMKLSSLIPKLTKHVIKIRNWRPFWYQLLEKHSLYRIQNIRSGKLMNLLHLKLITCTT